ncbi:MAG: hypothetical protein N2Z58_02375 [Fervidobacterium sp.]|nr:hypothetical protein [Fervidobacterium sp.]
MLRFKKFCAKISEINGADQRKKASKETLEQMEKASQNVSALVQQVTSKVEEISTSFQDVTKSSNRIENLAANSTSKAQQHKKRIVR